jgi:asparagine synthase (glutamine-hydrolysing)
MCGIAGIVSTRNSGPIDEALLRAMNDTMLHRGPDGHGLHIEPGVGLAHRRLSIIDLAAGVQPMFNEDGSVCIVFNGEIYNYRELAEELIAAGHSFRTRCDTEVIVHGWEEWGPDCLRRFNGMFGFAIWDRNTKTLFIARDRLGIKPVYYSFLPNGQVIFASELKALMRHPQLSRKLNVPGVEDYLTFGYVPEPSTIFAGVYKLEPGYYLKVDTDAGTHETRCYWDVDFSVSGADSTSNADLLGELTERLTSAVRRRLVADVPLGAFLSGGVDSSAIVAMMAGLTSEPVKTCSISFDDSAYDESEYADLVARQYQTDHHFRTVQVDDFALLDRLVGMYDEPYADSSAIPTYRVCGVARETVKVALSGDGGDENFAGYRRYRLFQAEETLRSLVPARVRRPLFGVLGRYYPKLDWAPRVFRGKTTFQALARDSADAYLHGVSLAPHELRWSMFSTEFKRRLQGYNSRAVFDRYLESKSFPDAMSMVQYLDLKTYLVGDILTKVDRASMAHSLEVRVPFLDHEFVEWAATIPSTLKLRRGEGKYLLKKSLEPALPESVLYRRKMGFAVPLDRWFRGPLVERIQAIPDSRWLQETGIFDAAALRAIVQAHVSRRRNYTPVIWSLLMFEGFLKREAG